MGPVGPGSITHVLERLYRRATFGIRPGTERVARLLEVVGASYRHRAHPPLAIVHVTGTNGKGSVCAMIEALARAHGLHTALYTSPHLVRFHERIRVDGRPIADSDLDARITEIEEIAARLWPNSSDAPTFFEIATVVAFRHFDLVDPQVRVIEVGMGGTHDATNVVEPTVAVISGVDLDHTQHLGATRAEIAREKAGVIKSGAPIVVGPLPADAREVVERTAAERGTPLIVAAQRVQVRRLATSPTGQWVALRTAEGLALELRLPLLGAHQADNLATALAAFQVMLERFGPPETAPSEWPARIDLVATRIALEHVVWPARMQRLEDNPDVWLDGAHNPQAAAVLAATLDELGEQPTALVVGMMADKDSAGFFRALAPRISRVWTVPIANERAASPADLARRAAETGLRAEPAPSVEEAIASARAWASTLQGRVIIAGSLFLAGEVLARRQGERLFDNPSASS